MKIVTQYSLDICVYCTITKRKNTAVFPAESLAVYPFSAYAVFRMHSNIPGGNADD